MLSFGVLKRAVHIEALGFKGVIKKFVGYSDCLVDRA
jgi:hypothetical protein